MTRVLCDFHHSSLLTSLSLLFEDRLGWELYRPIGLDWYEAGFWKINDQIDTAKQYLEIDGQPLDNTPPLNDVITKVPRKVPGIYRVKDPGNIRFHWAATLEFFKNNQFDYVIASIPAHVEPFKQLIHRYNPQAKLIVQMGNNWQGYDFGDLPVMASVKGPIKARTAFHYHQEFDLDIFHPSPITNNLKVHSFVNIIQNTGSGWTDYQYLKDRLKLDGFSFKAYGGQCPDGNMNGPVELANKMREADLIYHVKPGGDGFGHIIHNSYAVGRPIITRPSHYRGQLAEDLLVPGTFIDMDKLGPEGVSEELYRLAHSEEELGQMGIKAYAQFKKVVDYNKEAEDFKQWIESLQ